MQQFFYVAGGALIAILFYSSNLPAYVKWPLIVFFFLLGIALAFFPLEDRPLAKWIILFIKAIYSPTLYVWKQLPAKFSYFQAESNNLTKPTQNQPPQPFIQFPPKISDKLENEEKKFLDKVTKDIRGLTTQLSPAVPLKKDAKEEVARSQVSMPKTEKVHIETQEEPKSQPVQDVRQTLPPKQGYKLTPSAGQKTANIHYAMFSPEAAPPLPPTKPNVIVGQVVDTQGKIVENAILEIKDSEGRPARALRSNKLGHFMIVTPLADGNYEITTEKEGYIFDTIRINVKGEIVPPLAIWAKTKVQSSIPEPIKV